MKIFGCQYLLFVFQALCAGVRPYSIPLGSWGNQECEKKQGFICQAFKSKSSFSISEYENIYFTMSSTIWEEHRFLQCTPGQCWYYIMLFHLTMKFASIVITTNFQVCLISHSISIMVPFSSPSIHVLLQTLRVGSPQPLRPPPTPVRLATHLTGRAATSSTQTCSPGTQLTPSRYRLEFGKFDSLHRLRLWAIFKRGQYLSARCRLISLLDKRKKKIWFGEIYCF